MLYGIKVFTLLSSEIISFVTGLVSLLSFLTGDWKVGAVSGGICAFCAVMTRSLASSLMKEDLIDKPGPPDYGCAA